MAGSAQGAREIVILLDRSANMGYGDHWKKAQEAARKAVEGIGREDQATLILFGTGTEEAVRATSDRGRLQTAIDAAMVSSEATRYAPALRWAQSHLTRSALPRKEVVFISDFQKSGWERQEEIHMPEGTVMTVEFWLDGELFIALNGGPHFKFNEAISFVVHCKSQEEVDDLWAKLSEGGDPNAQQCGWLKDRFGLSWQVVPTLLNEMVMDPDRKRSDRVMKAMLQMKKLDIAGLRHAYEGM